MGENGPLSSSSELMMIFRGLLPRCFNYDCQPLYLVRLQKKTPNNRMAVRGLKSVGEPVDQAGYFPSI